MLCKLNELVPEKHVKSTRLVLTCRGKAPTWGVGQVDSNLGWGAFMHYLGTEAHLWKLNHWISNFHHINGQAAFLRCEIIFPKVGQGACIALWALETRSRGLPANTWHLQGPLAFYSGDPEVRQNKVPLGIKVLNLSATDISNQIICHQGVMLHVEGCLPAPLRSGCQGTRNVFKHSRMAPRGWNCMLLWASLPHKVQGCHTGFSWEHSERMVQPHLEAKIPRHALQCQPHSSCEPLQRAP